MNDFEWSAGKFPQPLQEIFIIDDLLNILTGISGKFILFNERSDEFELLIDESLSPTILEAIRPLLQAAK